MIDAQCSMPRQASFGSKAIQRSSTTGDLPFSPFHGRVLGDKMVQFSYSEEPAESPVGKAASAGERPARKQTPPFTLDSANRVLPLVSRIARDLVRIFRDLERDAAQIHGIQSLRLSGIQSFHEELDCVKESFRVDRERLQQLHQELEDLGVIVESPAEGIFDFPAVHQNRPVRLCWKLGEPEIRYWHAVGQGFADRRPVAQRIAK